MAYKFIPGKTVEVPEIQYTNNVVLPARKTALLVVDMQNDFAHPDGSLFVAAARDTITEIEKLVDSARKMGVHVAFTQDTHFIGDREWEIWPKHCEKDSWGWRIIEELQPDRQEMVFQKNRYDGFYGTALEHYLSRIWQTEHLVVVGTVSNICVAHTAASAGLRWFHVVAPANGMSAQNEFDQAMTLRQVSTLYAGNVVQTVDQIHFELELEELKKVEA